MPKKLSTKQQLQNHIAKRIGSINNSNTAQLRKINKLKNVKPRPQVPLSDFYMLVAGVWKHKGQGCRLCGSILSDPVVLDKHRYICKVLNKKEEDE